MSSERGRHGDEDAITVSGVAQAEDSLPATEDDEVSGYMMSVPTHLQVDEASGEEDEVQT